MWAVIVKGLGASDIHVNERTCLDELAEYLRHDPTIVGVRLMSPPKWRCLAWYWNQPDPAVECPIHHRSDWHLNEQREPCMVTVDKTCGVCRGAIPNGVEPEGHTALCAAVVATEKAKAIETAWGIIANAYGGNWENASPAWRKAAERWRDQYVTAPRKALSVSDGRPA